MPAEPSQTDDPVRSRVVFAALGLLVLIALCYANATSGPFIFDDTAAIAENPSIRQLSSALTPPTNGLPVTGRPVVNVSFAANYAIGELNPRGYHLVNIALHAATALLFFGLVRRTLRRPVVAGRFGTVALPLAWVATALWAVHPMNTAAVTYLSQRAEVLMALFYVGTLYAFCRSLEATRSWRWLGLSVVCCWLGMATKEVMASAPLVLLLYDRTFGAGAFATALRARWRYYAALVASWGLLAVLMTGHGGRGGTAGFGIGITPWTYLLTQCEALVHYLRLAFWPSTLVFDYGGTLLVTDPKSVLPQAMLLLLLACGTVWALWRKPAAGFLGFACFAILAPTSSVVPVADTMFEHRMYLPLALLVVLGATLAYRSIGRWSGMAVLLCVPLAAATVARNTDYRSELALWSDTVAKRPGNVRGHFTLGVVLAAEGRLDDAIAQFQAALKLDPKSAKAYNGLANVYARVGRRREAIDAYEAALRISPSAEAHSNLANVLFETGDLGGARDHYLAALRMRPGLADAHNNLGNLLARTGDFGGAIEHYQAALELRPDLADAHGNLANVLAQTGRFEDAIRQYEAAIKLRPDFADAHFNLATTFARLGKWREAAAEYESTLKAKPGYPGAGAALEQVRAAGGLR